MRSMWHIGIMILLGITLLPVAGTGAQAPGRHSAFLYLGADLSYVNEMEDCGGEYREDGVLADPFEILAEHGANLVRVRLWHDPTWTQYSNLDDVKKTILRARTQRMAVLLDFHYSDTWADPSKQIIPAAWADLSDDELEQAVYDYTLSVLTDLDLEGLTPAIVQVGNEINTEILRGENEAGYPINWERNARLINAGIRAVRDAGWRRGNFSKVMLHIAQPENVEGWLLAAERAGVTDFDIIGMSYYPGWSNTSVEGVGKVVNKLTYEFDKRVMIVETAYPWTLDGVNESASNILGSDFLLPDYPATPAGQKQFLIDLTQAVAANGGLGVVYWEPAWISTSCSTLWGQGSHWENATFFDFHHENNVHEGIEFLAYDYDLPVRIDLEVSLMDMNAPQAYLWGDFTGLGRRLVPMDAMDIGMYVRSAWLMPGQTITYAFYSGPNRAADQEVLDTVCANADGVRTLVVPDSDMLVLHGFGSCDTSMFPLE